MKALRLEIQPFEELSRELTWADEVNLTVHLMGLMSRLEFDAQALRDARIFVSNNRETLSRRMKILEEEKQWGLLRQLWMVYREELSPSPGTEEEVLAADFQKLTLGEAACLVVKFPKNAEVLQGVWAQKDRLGKEATAICQKKLRESAVSGVTQRLRTHVGFGEDLYPRTSSHNPGALTEIASAMRDMRVIASVCSERRGADPWFGEHGVVAFLKKEQLLAWRSRIANQTEGRDLLKILADQVCMTP